MSDKTSKSCQRPDCTVKMVRFACSKCDSIRYCSIRCQMDDWPRHQCIGAPIGASGDQPLFSLVERITRDALSYQRAMFHLRRKQDATSPAKRAGLIGRGADSAVLAVSGKRQGDRAPSYALKLSISDGRNGIFAVAGQMDILVHRTLQEAYATEMTPLPKLHADWTVFTSLTNYFANFDVDTYEGSRSQQQDADIIKEIVRTAPPGVAPQTIRDMPIHMSCALMEILGSTVSDVMRRYLPDPMTAADIPSLMSNVCTNIVASLATWSTLQVTHNDLHLGNVYITTLPLDITAVDYLIGNGEYCTVPTRHPGLPGLFVQNARVVIADFGRAAVGKTNTNLGMWLSGWPHEQPLRSLMNWPNYNNPGYDMWVFACDVIRHYGILMSKAGTPPIMPQLPPALQYMVPDDKLISELRTALGTHQRRVELLEPFQLISDAVNNRPGAVVRAAHMMQTQDATGRYLWRIPWLPRFFRSPKNALSGLASAGLCSRRTSRSPKSTEIAPRL